MWDIIVLATYLILSCVYLWAQIQAERGKVSAVALRIISVIALVTAVLVHSVTAWIFSLQQGHEMWHTALLAPWFVSSALVCGTALVMAIVIGLRRAGYLNAGARQHRASRQAPRRLRAGGFVLLRLRPAHRGLPGWRRSGGSGPADPRSPGALLLVRDHRLRRVRRHLPDPGPASQRSSGDGIAAGHRGHLLQARAAAGGRIPNR